MVDIFSEEKRSKIMSAVSSEDTTPEMKVRKYLHRKGYRYRVHHDVEGSPDIAFTKPQIAIFVHGCFWHQHECDKSEVPDSNRDYWVPKLERNKKRDQEKIDKLEAKGWSVKVVWGCEIKDNFDVAMDKLTKFIDQGYQNS